ncbi:MULTISPECIES: mycofactocin-coupled SDR family oxidoreductase [Pseudonocardia]|uniref:(-)-trans-carveol dehydrogenase n=2 Tax=Pseudonocardia TaxID=1847 RepID=A0A1Y2N035_PSEAH|nr:MULTISPECIES: mycofactocin-coupled SDR family oxidoreductase [Pseudonocardia]OSY40782.1 (-)-trans-carveol dehydrogenase [Pseudonocardia autotrophica]TDN71911.1 SDR family mycofactocin-dependent oxidoreductase [Pseudonocardia autotrophica]BBG02599.1 oxidoreductase [Pseudonocardia autotrophica]GEC24658.1 oxidoreductase [Pseudonocardia saturnea]
MTRATHQQVALISGVARGQGRAHALRLAEAGASIIGFDALQEYPTVPFGQATQDDLDETVALVEQAGGQIHAARADARDRAAVTDVVEHGVKRLGNLTSVVVNAGIGIESFPFWEIPQDSWQDCIDVNLTGAWNTASAAVPSMLDGGRGGSIVLTSSAAALKAAPNLGAYTAAKTGLIGLMRCMAADLAPHRIRANCVCPTSVPTEFLHNERLFRIFRPDLDSPTVDDARPVMAAMHPLGEPWIEVQDVTSAVAFLLSEESRYITGVTLPIDLGLSIKF